MQDADKLLADSPLAKKIGSTVTDIAGRLDVLVSGAGRKKGRRSTPLKGGSRFTTMPVKQLAPQSLSPDV